MARTNTADTANYLLAGSAPVTDSPFSFACWASVDVTNNAGMGLMYAGNSGSGIDVMRLTCQGNVANDPVRIQLRNNVGDSNFADSTAGPTDATWFHAAGTSSATDTVRAYFNGGNSGSASGAMASPSISESGIGMWRAGASISQALDGAIGHAAWWDIELSAAQIATLAGGLHPYLMAPANLQGYLPMTGASAGAEVDLVSGISYAETGTMGQSGQPHVVVWPAWPSVSRQAAAAGGLTIPVAMHSYRKRRAA